MANILLGLLIVCGGCALIYYANVLTQFFGSYGWAERNLGGTRSMYALIGVGCIVIGCLFVFGVFTPGDLSSSVDSPSFGGVGVE